MTKKIAFLISDLEGGGEEKILTISANFLANQGYQIDVVLCHARGVYLKSLLPGIKIVNLTVEPRISVLEIYKYLKHHQPNILISTNDALNWNAIIAKILSRTSTKVITRISTTISKQIKPSLKRVLLKTFSTIIYPFADQIITVSYESEKDFLRFTRVDRERVRTIYNPAIIPDLSELANLPPDHRWLGNNKPPVILGVGRLHRHKNFPNLIRAFKLVLAQRDARLLILGEGGERGYLEQLVGDLNLKAYVSMPGFEVNPYPFMKNAAVFALSSDVEGLPTALIEALACGCQSVSTTCSSGPYEILEGGKHGYLVTVDDPHALAKAILRILAGERKPKNMGNLVQFHVEPAMRKYKSLILELL